MRNFELNRNVKNIVDHIKQKIHDENIRGTLSMLEIINDFISDKPEFLLFISSLQKARTYLFKALVEENILEPVVKNGRGQRISYYKIVEKPEEPIQLPINESENGIALNMFQKMVAKIKQLEDDNKGLIKRNDEQANTIRKLHGKLHDIRDLIDE